MSTLPNSTVPPLMPGRLHVWRLSLEVDPSVLADYRRIVSTDESLRAERFARPELRRRFLVARANLRQLLGHYAGCPPESLRFAYGPAGKPELAGTEAGRWHFNVSHSGEQALIAVAPRGRSDGGGMVGIDLEMIRSLDYEAVARSVLTEAEMLLLRQADAAAKADMFFRLWVRHEAQVKAIGGGIGTSAVVPVYDLDVGPDYRAAAATDIEDVRIEVLDRC